MSRPPIGSWRAAQHHPNPNLDCDDELRTAADLRRLAVQHRRIASAELHYGRHKSAESCRRLADRADRMARLCEAAPLHVDVAQGVTVAFDPPGPPMRVEPLARPARDAFATRSRRDREPNATKTRRDREQKSTRNRPKNGAETDAKSHAEHAGEQLALELA